MTRGTMTDTMYDTNDTDVRVKDNFSFTCMTCDDVLHVLVLPCIFVRCVDGLTIDMDSSHKKRQKGRNHRCQIIR